MRISLFSLLVLIFCRGLLSAQIVVGDREYSRVAKEIGARGEWVLYPKGAPQVEGNRRWLTKRVLVEAEAGADLQSLPGIVKSEQRGGFTLLTFEGGADAGLRAAGALRKVAGVKSAVPLLARQQFRRFVPNDPLFSYDAGNPGYQWHLQNTGQNGATAGVDANVVTAWDLWKGAGVRIGIVDDGLQVAHPDLAANADTVESEMARTVSGFICAAMPKHPASRRGKKMQGARGFVQR